jgi:hypothetical protein
MDLIDEKKFFPILSRLVECRGTDLAKAGGPSLCYCGLMIGDVTPLALMDCSTQCGVAWVRPAGAFPSTSFPLPVDASQAISCASPLAMAVEVGVARCAPRGQGKALYPDPQDMFDAARLYMSDMAAMRRAILCCGKQSPEVLFSLGEWSPIPVQGGVSGGVWSISVG